MKVTRYLFKKITSLSYIFQCWDQFRRGKRKRKDVQCFERHLEDRLFQLQHDLITLQYEHAPYHHFNVSDPKQRRISKASVRDRLVHQIIHGVLSDFLDQKFIFHSLSSRLGKGTHFGVLQLQKMIRQLSKNGKQPCYALKMDIKRFFDTVDHAILKALLWKNIRDEKTLKIIDTIIDSFRKDPLKNVGIPLDSVVTRF
ncbi:MAG: RNA-dependent DNA polymerase, partial [Verrucomicrobia bacterium]|nr:RNA-dependent DNA polymerase [Verrucomicrobiota bacterium]